MLDPEESRTHFYRWHEVERAAEPESDWNLDAATLNAAGVPTLVFDIFISESGEVVACTIVAPEALPLELRLELEERVRQTPLRPAIRVGTPVASVRRIEVSSL